MRAAVIHAYGGPDELKFEDRLDPIAGPGEVRINVAATSVTPFDIKLRSGALKNYFPLTFPFILGFDVSGTVEAVGPGVETLVAGDRVFGQAQQAYATLSVVKAADLAKLPESMDLITVAARPTVTTTGAQVAMLALGAKPRATAGHGCGWQCWTVGGVHGQRSRRNSDCRRSEEAVGNGQNHRCGSGDCTR
jgi:NADPH:quinone reductase-like Zn-dependent oxidoreductase